VYGRTFCGRQYFVLLYGNEYVCFSKVSLSLAPLAPITIVSTVTVFACLGSTRLSSKRWAGSQAILPFYEKRKFLNESQRATKMSPSLFAWCASLSRARLWRPSHGGIGWKGLGGRKRRQQLTTGFSVSYRVRHE
jgi:hypothetical protein